MILKTPYDYAVKARKMGKKTISYSQISTYTNCPHHWKLEKIDKHSRFEPNMFLIFGTAFHETFQLYLDTMYKETAVAADRLDLNKILKEKMASEYSERLKNETDGKHFSCSEEMSDFYSDGVAILEWFKKKRGAYFSKKYTELVGIEMPIFSEVEYNKNVMFMGFMDLVLKEHDTIKIIDIKTSYMGWKDKKKKKEGNQLRLYKKYFAEQYGTDIKNIEVEYFIVKRKLYENCDFPQKRIQQYRPASGKPSINKVDKMLKEFVDNVFNEDGSYNKNGNFPAYKNDCTYCPFKKEHDLCPPKSRVLKPC
tara:strand:- start:430 stop:1356 length:927 start_codon:yes stop_codon:yes gene_type:complete